MMILLMKVIWKSAEHSWPGEVIMSIAHDQQPRTPRGRWRYLGKVQRIYVRVTPAEKALITHLADQAQMTISDYLIQSARLGNVKFLRQYLSQ